MADHRGPQPHFAPREFRGPPPEHFERERIIREERDREIIRERVIERERFEIYHPRTVIVAAVPEAEINIAFGGRGYPPPPPPAYPDAASNVTPGSYGDPQQGQGGQAPDPYQASPRPNPAAAHQLQGNLGAVEQQLNSVDGGRFGEGTHLKFKIDKEGVLSADAHSFNKLPENIQQQLLPADGSIHLDASGKHMVVEPGITDADIQNFQNNARAIGEGVNGHRDKAALYNKNTGQPTDLSGQQQGSNPNLNSDGTIGDGQQPANQQAPNQQPTAPIVRPEPQQSAPEEAPKPAPAAPAPDASDQTLFHNKLAVGEAQEILRRHGASLKLDGEDTLKNGGLSKTDAAMEAALGHEVGGGGSMTQGDLKELEKKYNITDQQKAEILKEVAHKLHLSGVVPAPQTSADAGSPAAPLTVADAKGMGESLGISQAPGPNGEQPTSGTYAVSPRSSEVSRIA